MGAAMVSLVDHAHDGRTPAATGWVLGAGAAVLLGATMLLAASLQAWHRERGLYRRLARTCAAAAVACLGVGGARPAPLILGLALVLLLGIPWGLAVAYRLANGADLPVESPIRHLACLISSCARWFMILRVLRQIWPWWKNELNVAMRAALSRSRSAAWSSQRLFDDGRQLPRAVRGVTRGSPGHVPVRTYQDTAGSLHLPA